ncbi:hypothetical protein ACFYUD_31510 [Nocardia tengchongensis]|uniref:hypothetical protein n=1 Tax=Nocardia tengchongensis TaxID=2055889 RepID=UPI0036AD1A16
MRTFLPLLSGGQALKDWDPTWSVDTAVAGFLTDWENSPEAASLTPVERAASKAGLAQATQIVKSGGTACP